MGDLNIDVFMLNASVWALPVLLAITMHEAAHGWAASRLGDPTARLMGRVTLNPFAHVDLFGTILLPLLLLVIGAPFLFGYAKPVPVNFSRLRHPRRDMALVALAGPASNILLAIIASLIALAVGLTLPTEFPVLAWLLSFQGAGWANEIPWIYAVLLITVGFNLVIAVFNLMPCPPLDGGRILVSILPDWAAWKVARLERAGLFIVIGTFFLVPYLTSQLGYTVDIAGTLIWAPVDFLARVIAFATGHGGG